jgi:dethiobiotin synthetase
MAADVLGRPPFTITDLVDELHWPPEIDVGLLETVGGPRSPVASDGDSIDLVRAVAPDTAVLVADAGLGTVNAVRLSLAALLDVPTTVLLNRYDASDDLHRRNRRWLEDVDGADVAVDVGELAARLQPMRSGSLRGPRT